MRKTILHIGALLLFAASATAQPGALSNLRQRFLPTQPDSVLLDSLPVIPASLLLTTPAGERLDSTHFSLTGNYLYWRPSARLRTDSVLARYRVLPYDLRRAYSHLDTAALRRNGDEDMVIGYTYNPYERNEASLFDFRGLDYNGSFARGLSFGNNQDLVLNSSFNLQLAGDLGEGIEVLAAITDENIPLQPEGNTQQLREFDKIFIQLTKDNNQLTAGDYELQRPGSYFMNYFKKLQGATFRNETELPGGATLRSNASIAISRGQFARNQIQQQEGNQGPYKLRGAEGERFIIVLAGTEKVWLDGQTLKRGLEEDYIIDYNRGEITFTNRRLITKDSRIIAEFEYSDQNYLRSLYALNTEYRHRRLRVYGNFFSQQDSKTSTGNQTLNDADKRILSEAGDQLDFALSSSIDTLEEFAAFRVAYKQIDTLLACGRRDTILVYSTDPDSARFTARFTFVGAGNGHYILDPEIIANERVYRWVEPGPNCSPQGEYAPVTRLIAPKQQQLFTAGAEYQLSNRTNLRTELAMSRNDLNRFSIRDSDDDLGLAGYTTLGHRFDLGADSSGWTLDTELSYEFVQRDFRALNPYRAPEFLRDWSLANQQGVGNVDRATEHLGRTGLTLNKAGLGSIGYAFSGFLRDTLYQGQRHEGRLLLNHRGWKIDADGSLLQSDDRGERNRFFRPRVTLAKSFAALNNWQVGWYGERERNERYAAGADTLRTNSFYYDLHRFFVKSPEQGKGTFGASYQQRFDYAPAGALFLRNTTAEEANANGEWRPGRALRLAGNVTYRKLIVDKAELTTQEAAETFLGRTDLTLNLWKGALQSTTTYEIGSGQEPKLELTYVRVNPGEGTHIWLDSLYNNDGQIQPNEMEIAPFADLADYVPVTTFTDEFIRTDYASLNQSLRLNPKAVWYGNKNGLRPFLNRFSTQSSLKVNRKTQPGPGISPWNPLQFEIPDTALVSIRSGIRNVLFFNRSDPKYDLQFSHTDNWTKFVQTTGFESRRTVEYSLRGRLNLGTVFSAVLETATGSRRSGSQFFAEKDFRIDFRKLQPELTWLPSKNFRAIIRYLLQTDQNRLTDGNGESSLRHDFNLEATYNRTTATSIRARFNLVDVGFDGNANSPVGFAILNGLQKGKNFLWNLTLDRQLARNVRLNLSYEGRKTGTARVVHVGRAQVAATF